MRASFARILYSVGVLQLIFHLRLRNRAIVLMYHRVVSREDREFISSHPGIIVDTDAFEKHLGWLRKHFDVVSLSEFKERMISRRHFQEPTCLITFDDGWQDNFCQAFPLLERYGLPAVIFLPVGFIGTKKRFWQEYLTHSLFQALLSSDGEKHLGCEKIFEKLGLDRSLLTPDEVGKVKIQKSISQAKTFSDEELGNLISETHKVIDRQSKYKENFDTFLSWEQVKRMAGDRINFGSHTVNHKILTKIPFEQVQKEVRLSKLVLENQLGDETIAFSYPNGNYNAEVKKIVISNGYQLAFSTEPGLVSPEDDAFTIKRINVHQEGAPSIPLLLARILGIF